MEKLLFIVLFSLIFIQCRDDDTAGLPLVSLIYQETSCADPWGFVGPDDDLETVVSDYLIANVDGTFSAMETIEDPSTAQGCLACQCLTGWQIHISVLEQHVLAFEEVGFFRE